MQHPNDLIYFAHDRDARISLSVRDRRMHCYAIGRSGSGKSTLLENMIIQDIRAGRGLAVIDPHGDLVDHVLPHVPQHRLHHVIYIDPTDREHAVGFNIFQSFGNARSDRTAAAVLAVFQKHWEIGANTPRLENILRNFLHTITECQGATLLWLLKLARNAAFRKKLAERVRDPIVRSFWRDEFYAWNERYRMEALAPLQNKVSAFATDPIIRHIVGQQQSKINIRAIMDRQLVLLVRLPKGVIGEDATNLLGSLFVSAIELAAQSRADTPEHERKDFALYIDEFQNFATKSFASILSEARKYRLSLIMANQFLSQLDRRTRDAIVGTVGTLILFRIGMDDARLLEAEFSPQPARELVDLSAGEILYKRVVKGGTDQARRARTFPSEPTPENHWVSDIIANSRAKYARKTSEVAAEIETFFAGERK